MQTKIRQTINYLFTSFSVISIVLLVAALLLFLIPMLGKGVPAVIFRGTVEFRKMQHELYHRGDKTALKNQTLEAEAARSKIYAILDRFSRGIDTASLEDETKGLYRSYGDQLRYQDTPREKYFELRNRAKVIRDHLLDAFESTDKQDVFAQLDAVQALRDDAVFSGTPIEKMFAMAEDFRNAVKNTDLSKRDEYAGELATVKEELYNLFGPRPGEKPPQLAMKQFGATRWDVARKHLKHLVWEEKWVPAKGSKRLEKKLVRRDDPAEGAFAGTDLAPLFALTEQTLQKTLEPKFTFYWQYFIDDSTPGHYFGGVGPEILGTLLLTLLAMCFSIPFGVISAAYLVEYAGDNFIIKTIRICINTLAGVPSIVYGLFGLAFFVRYFTRQPCILSASLTLGLLVLPVIIRASEEAIRAVPRTYREAAMGLGAGKFRTFLTVTLPAAGPGILTGIILSLSRAAGETAPILFTGAVAYKATALNFAGQWWMQPTMALPYGCYDITVGDKLATMVPHNQYGMVMTLIVLILCLNIVAIVIRSRMSRKLRGM